MLQRLRPWQHHRSAGRRGSFSKQLIALDTDGLDEVLQDDGPLTLFAPTDTAFAEIGITTVMPTDFALPPTILQYHVLEGIVDSQAIVGFDALDTVIGFDITVVLKNTGVFLNGDSKLIQTDIPANNGIIHVIDKVLLY